jgi:lysophosphatidylcholine acyltransferase/lyso-PAF acetyltransferase
MCQFGNAVTVEVLPVYKPSQAEKDDPALYAANIRKLIVSGTA